MKAKKTREKMTADVRVKMKPSDKELFIAGAEADGYAEVSAWFRRCALERIAQLRQEGKLKDDPPLFSVKAGANAGRGYLP